MKRELYNKLIEWKNSPNRKPLILNGARQVGKSWLLEEFGRSEYERVVRFSLDRAERARAVFESKGPVEEMLRKLSALAGEDIMPSNTLLIIDEVQECPQAIECLKYFCEDAPDIHIAVAGSLLGIALHAQVSFPVGKVEMLRLYPMTFSEFLCAVGKQQMADELRKGDWSVIDGIRSAYIELLRQYYYVGGMPAAVLAYVGGEGLVRVRQVQQQILAAYEEDFSKHAPHEEVPRLRMVWQSIPSQLAKENKKFIYGAIRKGARATQFEVAIQWLIDAGLVYRVNRVSAVKMPLKFYEEFSVFKLFVHDIGLMGAMVNAPASEILVDDSIFSEYKGAFTELFVCMQMMASGVHPYYHSPDNSRVELDFVVQLGTGVWPVEVKAEENVHSKSLRTFIASHPEEKGLRLSMKPYIDQEWMENVPLYAFREYFLRMAAEPQATF